MSAIDMNLTLDQAVPRETNYIGKQDLATPRNVTIASFNMAKVSDDQPEMLICHFSESDVKPLIIKSTNKQLLELAHPDCQGLGDYVGKRIELFVDPTVSFGGKIVGGVRIRPVPAATDPNDDIPF